MTPQEARDGVTELRHMLSYVMRELSTPRTSLADAAESLAKVLRRGSKLWFYMLVDGGEDGD